jgi:hypothetical protein
MKEGGALMELCREGNAQVPGYKPVSVSLCPKRILKWLPRNYGMAQDEIPVIVSRKTCSQWLLLPENYDNFISGQMLYPLQIDVVIYLTSLFDH